MADAEGVVLGFLALRERRDAVLLLDGMDLVAAAGEDLVRIALVADVPDDAVVGRVVEVMQGDGEFDHAEAGAEMAAALADRFDQVGAQFLGDRGQFVFVELAQVGGNGDAGQARVATAVERVGVDHASIVNVTPCGGRVKAAAAPRRGYLPRRRPNNPLGFCGSGSGSGSLYGSANPVARLALMKSTTSSRGTPLAAVISSSVAGPFIIAVAMRKCLGNSRSVCGHLPSLNWPSGSKPGSSAPLPASRPAYHCSRASGCAGPSAAASRAQVAASASSKSAQLDRALEIAGQRLQRRRAMELAGDRIDQQHRPGIAAIAHAAGQLADGQPVAEAAGACGAGGAHGGGMGMDGVSTAGGRGRLGHARLDRGRRQRSGRDRGGQGRCRRRRFRFLVHGLRMFFGQLVLRHRRRAHAGGHGRLDGRRRGDWRRVRPGSATMPFSAAMLLSSRDQAVGAQRAHQVVIGLRALRRGQADHALARGMQAQPAHRAVHAVHVDHDVVGVVLAQQLPVTAGLGIRGLERGVQFRLDGRVHAGGA